MLVSRINYQWHCIRNMHIKCHLKAAVVQYHIGYFASIFTHITVFHLPVLCSRCINLKVSGDVPKKWFGLPIYKIFIDITV